LVWNTVWLETEPPNNNFPHTKTNLNIINVHAFHVFLLFFFFFVFFFFSNSMYHQPRTQQLKPTTFFSSLFCPKCPLNHNLLLLLPKPNKKPTISASMPPGPASGPDQALISLLRSIPDWADTVQERGMQKKRSLYTHLNWRDHRSSLRHLRHLLSSLSSRVILSLVPPVLFFTGFAAAIASYNQALILHILPDFLPLLHSSSLPYQLTAPALALLLVFRTEASYARFVEGKKAWTNVIAGTHDFARQAAAILDDVDNADFSLKHALLQYIIAFPIALKVSLSEPFNFNRNFLYCGKWQTNADRVADCSVNDCFLKPRSKYVFESVGRAQKRVLDATRSSIFVWCISMAKVLFQL